MCFAPELKCVFPHYITKLWLTCLTRHYPTLAGQWSVQERCSRLTSPLIKVVSHVRVLLSCQSFAMSASLQRGIRLLCWLRPPTCTLAFSCPAKAGQATVEFPSSNAKDVIATLSCLLHSGRIRNNLCRSDERHSPRRTFWFRCLNHFHLSRLTKPSPQVSLVSIGRRTGRSTVSWLTVVELLSAGFAPQPLPMGGRTLRSPDVVVQTSLLKSNLSRR